MATGAVPETNGGNCAVQELPVSELKCKEFKILPNKTNSWVRSDKIWLQPEDEDHSLCQTGEEGHSHIEPCSNGGQQSQHSLLGHQMACALVASAVDPDNPFRWASYSSQGQAATGVQSMSVLTTGVRSPPIFVD